MAEIGWGGLADTEGFGTLGDISEDFKVLSSQELASLGERSQLTHAAHGMIFARQKKILWNLYDMKGMVMMQVRFDGILGFPGGIVDQGEAPTDGLNREMEEEIGLDLSKYCFAEKDRIVSYLNESKQLVLHFYVLEVTPDAFGDLEKNTLGAVEYGVETFGIVRVPLFTMGDGVRGFPAFLANQFAGNARDELMRGLLASKLITELEMAEALKAYNNLCVAQSQKVTSLQNS